MGLSRFPEGRDQIDHRRFIEGRPEERRIAANAPVAKVLAEDGATTGVELASGRDDHAPIVVSNADIWTTQNCYRRTRSSSTTSTNKRHRASRAATRFCTYTSA